MSVLNRPYFHDEEAAFAKLEAILWPLGPVCPHCGNREKVYDLAKTRIGLKKCAACRKQFTVRVGTVFESSHIPLFKWFQAVYLMASSKKGISAHQLHRVLEITYKSAWFMAHRIREAMRSMGLEPMGGAGVFVEADETFVGRKKGVEMKGGGAGHKIPVLSLVERGGSVRSFQLATMDAFLVKRLVVENIAKESTLMTDSAGHYRRKNMGFAAHKTVNHMKKEYVRKTENGLAHSNTAEGYFSLFKRGMRGVYQHCSEKHLHRYLAEFDFRYNNRVALGVCDHERAERALYGAKGKRLTYTGTDPYTE